MQNIWNILKKNLTKKSQDKNDNSNHKDYGQIKKDLKENIKFVKKTLGESNDIVFREFYVSDERKTEVSIIYTDGLVNQTIIQEVILKSLMQDFKTANVNNIPTLINPKIIKDNVLPEGEITEIKKFEDLFNYLLSGDTILLINGYNEGLSINSKGWKERGVEEPTAQTVIRGPKDGFCETLKTNKALLRRRIKDPNLWFETKKIGRRTKTDVTIAYLNGVTNDKILKEVHRRIDKIDIDGIIESGNLEELIQDENLTFFPTVHNTERPDVTTNAILQGKVAILVDGTPFVLIVPALFYQFFHTTEDYYHRADISTVIRILRFSCFFISMLTPSIYIAVTTFHQEMIPSDLLVSIAAQREGVPFPAFVEALLMEFTFEILREAGIRMPRAAGGAISIVGALVLGEAAVQAGIVSPIMIIVVSLTAISSFVFPTYGLSSATRILRFIFMGLSAAFGFFGVILGLIALTLHLCSLRSFGIPYMSPMAPFNLKAQKDLILRTPLYSLLYRPEQYKQKDIIRQKDTHKRKK